MSTKTWPKWDRFNREPNPISEKELEYAESLIEAFGCATDRRRNLGANVIRGRMEGKHYRDILKNGSRAHELMRHFIYAFRTASILSQRKEFGSKYAINLLGWPLVCQLRNRISGHATGIGLIHKRLSDC